jgi:hypothetical protein
MLSAEADLKFILCNSVSSEGIDNWTQQLLEGRHRHDVLEGYLREVEENEGIDSVGYGGSPNIIGEMELDASGMNGDNRVVGAVAAVKNFLPIRIARRLMEKGPHALVVGAGAERFARDCGLLPEPTLSPAQYEKWERHIKPMLESQSSVSLMELIPRKCRRPPAHSIQWLWWHRTVRVYPALAALPGGRGNTQADWATLPFRVPAFMWIAGTAGAGAHILAK